jgi:Arc/MetJ family transcription regulator
MRTTLNLDDRLLQEAQRLSGLTGRLAALGGSQKALKPVRRRRAKKGS